MRNNCVLDQTVRFILRSSESRPILPIKNPRRILVSAETIYQVVAVSTCFAEYARVTRVAVTGEHVWSWGSAVCPVLTWVARTFVNV